MPFGSSRVIARSPTSLCSAWKTIVPSGHGRDGTKQAISSIPGDEWYILTKALGRQQFMMFDGKMGLD